MATPSTGGSLIGKIGSYLQIVTKDPSSTAFVPLAEAYRQIGLLDDALEAARLGTKMLPHFSPGFSTMGRILAQMGRLDESMSAFARALSIDRQSQSALVGLSRLHLIRGERDQARKILLQAQEFHPTDEKISDMLIALDLPRPWAEIKQATIVQEQLSSSATDTAEPVEPLEPVEPIATATLAEIYVKQGLFEKALDVYRGILAQSPDNESAHKRIMQIQELKAGEADSAAADSGAADSVAASPDAAAVAPAADAAVESVAMPTQAACDAQRKPEDISPLAVLQRWLSVITNGRTNV